MRGLSDHRWRDIHLHLAALLRGSLGFDNQTLLGFGVKPRRPRKKKMPADTPQQQQPAAK
jgi:hypothetical protein